MLFLVSKEERNSNLFELIDHIDLVKGFFELKSLKTEEIIQYKPSLIYLINFLKSDMFDEMKDEFDLDIDGLLKKLNVLRVTYTERGIKSAEKGHQDLLDNGIEAFINNLQEKLYKLLRNPYDVWLERQNGLIQQLKKEQLDENYTFESIKILYDRFSQFIGSKLSVKLVNTKNDNYKFVPMFYFNGQYVELKNPLTNGKWTVSGNATNFKEQLDLLQRGTIIKVHYHIVNKHKPQFYDSILSLEYEDIEVLGDNFETILQENFTEIELRELHNKVNVRFGNSQMLAKEFIKLLIPNSEPLQKEIQDARTSSEQMKAEIDQLVNTQELLNLKRETLKSRMSEDQKRWVDILKLIEYETEVEPDQIEYLDYKKRSFIKDLQARIYNQNGNKLLYDEHILEVIINAIRSNILTILSGPSGTGKSSLIEALGEAFINVKVTLIPVQSSWTDAQDLLGYFHPNEKIFVATPFMEALATARIAALNNKDELHIICLDEMNLAHIEYYFAQFLSIREQKENKLHLYPKRYYQWALDVEANYIELDYYSKQNAKELLKRYPAIFEIPSNVRFVGTLNMDHTVKSLSPKVIDRSLIVELLKLSEEKKSLIETQITENNNSLPINVPLEEFLKSNIDYDHRTYENILQIANVFKGFRDIPLNSRGEKHLKDMLRYWDEPSIEIVDLLIKGKVLPRIEVKKSAIENLNVMDSLKDYTASSNKMIEMLNTNHTVSFW